MKYCGNSKPYIYVSFSKDDEVMALKLIEKLSSEGVYFWYTDKISKKELKRIEGAHAVLIFVSKTHLISDAFHKVVNHAVRCNKNILSIYLDDVLIDKWGHMQLDSAQALFLNKFGSDTSFYNKLKEAHIFRNMQVTNQQKKFKRNAALTAIFVPIASAILIVTLVIYPLLIVPAQREQENLKAFGISGLTQEELNAITEINIIGDTVLTDVSNIEIFESNEDGVTEYKVLREGQTDEYVKATEGSVTDLSDLKKCPNLKTLRICGNNVKDLSPLADLPKLEQIILDDNPISSLEGLEKLENVYLLSLAYTDVDDLDQISDYENLKILNARFSNIEKLPDTGVLENVKVLNMEGTLVSHVPYLGSMGDRTIAVYRTPELLDEYSFLKDVASIEELIIDGASPEELRPYLEGKDINKFNDASMNPKSLEEINWLNIRKNGRLCICHSNELVSLEGIEHFDGIAELDIKDCLNVTDLTPCLRIDSLQVLTVSTPMKPLVESQLTEATFEIDYRDD